MMWFIHNFVFRVTPSGDNSGFTVINEMGICYVISGKFFKGNKFSCDDRKVKSHFAQTIWICLTSGLNF